MPYGTSRKAIVLGAAAVLQTRMHETLQIQTSRVTMNGETFIKQFEKKILLLTKPYFTSERINKNEIFKKCLYVF